MTNATVTDPSPPALTDKIGQTLIIGFDGTTITPPLREMIEQYHVGGVILFARNVVGPEQVRRLITDLQAAAIDSGHPGLFVAIDQEGGRVARLGATNGFCPVPGAMGVAASGDVTNAARLARLIAGELRAVGVNVDFAPTLDVNNNPLNPVIGSRSWGSDPAAVAQYGAAFITALQGEGVLAVGKHFPGHGDTAVDLHLALPRVPHARERLASCEWVPFVAAIEADVAGIMSAHITFPAIEPDPGLPATLSPRVLTTLLRDELGYEGLVVTDSLEMLALREAGYPPPEAAVAALSAGADLLLFNAGHADHQAAISLIAQRIMTGQIPMARLDQAVARVLAAKQRIGIHAQGMNNPMAVGTAEHRVEAFDLVRRGLTVLRDAGGLLPLPIDECIVVETPSTTGFGAALGAPRVIEVGRQADQLLAAGGDGSPLLVGLAGLSRQPEVVQVLNTLIAQGAPVVVVALGEPYDLLLVPDAPAMVATYAAPFVLLPALRELLEGQTAPRGRLPVELPGLFPLGSGLQAWKERAQ